MATTVTGQRKWTGPDDREDYLVTGTRQSDTLTGNDGNDTINGADDNDVIRGGNGNDFLEGGKGDDTLTGGDDEDIFVYSSGDGNDVITDYTSGVDKIQFKSGKPKFKVNGSDVVITVGDGTITVKGAAEGVITYIDANGKEKNWPNVINIDNKTNTVTLTKFYKRASFYLASYDDDIQTVNAAAVTHDIKITGNVKNNKIVAGKGDDTLIGGKGNDTFTGGAGDDIFVYGSGEGNKVITDYENGDIISLTSGTVNYAGIDGSNIIFTVGKGRLTVKGAAGKKVHFRIADDDFYLPNGGCDGSCGVHPLKEGKGITLTNAFSEDSININTHHELKNFVNVLVTVDASAVDNNISITGTKKNNYIIGGEGDDTLIGGKGADTLTGGDGNDVFVWNKGDGNDIITDYEENDTIRFTSGTVKASIKGNDVVFTVGKAKITVKNAADKAITYIVGKKKYITSISKAIQYNAEGTAATLLSSYTDDKFTADSKLKNIDASAVDYGINIVANKLSNYILGTEDDDCINGGAGKDTIRGGEGNDTLIGGKGNDTLIGGKDTDVFVYNNGDGNDVITDYKEEDFIQFMSGKVTVKTVGNDVVFTLGKGKVTVKDGKDSFITYIDSEGTKTYRSDSPLFINSEGTAVTLKSTYSNKVFDVNTNTYVSDYAGSLKTIDASNVDNDLVIKGNKNNNVIYGAQGGNTIYGGKGNDTIVGGEVGGNLYVYNNGDGNDLILDWGSSDAVSIASGNLSGDVRVNGDTVIFTVGKGKISLQGAAGQSVTYWYDDEYHTQMYHSGNSDVLSDDNYEVTPSDLSAIVENKAIDYSVVQSDSSLSFTTNNNSTPQYTFANKKK